MSAKDEISVKISWCSKKERRSHFLRHFSLLHGLPSFLARLLTILLGQKREIKNFHQLLNRGCKIRQRFREKNEPFDKVQIFWFERKKSLKKTQWLDSIWCPWLPRNLIHTKAKEGNNGCERLCSLAWHNNDYCKHKHQKPTAQT